MKSMLECEAEKTWRGERDKFTKSITHLSRWRNFTEQDWWKRVTSFLTWKIGVKDCSYVLVLDPFFDQDRSWSMNDDDGVVVD